MSSGNKVIAGNSANGQLVHVGGNHYEGTRVMRNRKREKRRFEGRRCGVQVAWSKWMEEGIHDRQQQPQGPGPEMVQDVAPAGNASGTDEAESPDVGTSPQDAGPDDSFYVLQLTDGTPVYLFDDLVEAGRVKDALELALELAGSDVAYRLQAVRFWSV